VHNLAIELIGNKLRPSSIAGKKRGTATICVRSLALFHEDGVWILWTGEVWKGRTTIEEGHAAVHKTVSAIAFSANGSKS
jgi:hypothetical protein